MTEIIIDDSSFSLTTPADGSEGSDNPYDVPNGAAAVNFNSLAIQVAADQTISSGEGQTPVQTKSVDDSVTGTMDLHALKPVMV